MIRITNAQYADFAHELMACAEAVPDGYAIRYEKNGLTFSGVAYRNPEGEVRDIVPLWCEYRTYEMRHHEVSLVPNDFQWSELYKHFGFIK